MNAARRADPPPRSTEEPLHRPVMLDEVLSELAPSAGQTIVDCTFGAGGYSRAILDAGAAVIAIDRDPAARERAAGLERAHRQRFRFVPGRFGDLADHLAELGVASVEGVVLDVGVSSAQLDDPERGFSFRHDGPLDMRMGGEGISAADLVNTLPGRSLSEILSRLGEERRASAITRAIVDARSRAPIASTRGLATIVERVLGPGRPGDIHPATRTFQALRIVVNDELGELAHALGAAERMLAPGGRLVVVAFHSLEDRIVKRFLAERSRAAAGSRHAPATIERQPSFRLATRGVLAPSEEEVAANPRARSAKLRAAVRLPAPPHDLDPAGLGVPDISGGDVRLTG